MKRIILITLTMLLVLFVKAQGIIIYKNDGTRINVPYQQLDSIVTYGYVDPKETDKGNLVFTVEGIEFKMIAVKGGSFAMGASLEQADDALSFEYPVHNVTLTKDFYIGETEVTQSLWKAVTGFSPTSTSSWKNMYGLGDYYPAYSISYLEVQSFISKLNEMTGQTFRLPTEAEWEFCARGGNESMNYIYGGSNNLSDIAWYKDNSDRVLHEVKQKQPNELGLYDMTGNVWEMCSDWEGLYYYEESPSTDPQGPNSPESSKRYRIVRGGAFVSDPAQCRTSYRSWSAESSNNINLGFRLVLEK